MTVLCKEAGQYLACSVCSHGVPHAPNTVWGIVDGCYCRGTCHGEGVSCRVVPVEEVEEVEEP